jgi:hypothetical protein
MRRISQPVVAGGGLPDPCGLGPVTTRAAVLAIEIKAIEKQLRQEQRRYDG